MFDSADVVIVGAGMVGLTLACALKDSGLSVVIIERGNAEARKSLGRDCRVSAIVMGNIRILQGLGVWEHIRHDAAAILAMRIWDNQETGGIRFDCDEIDENALGYLIENSCTIAALHKTLLTSDTVEFCCPAEIAEVKWLQDQVCIQLADGRRIETRLIVGADGGRSWIRQQAGIGVYERDYHQQGIVATVRPERTHNGIAYQRFLPTGPLAMLPMTENLCSIVWSAENAEAKRLMAMDQHTFLNALNLTMGPVLGKIIESGDRAAFPLTGRLAKHFVRSRLALVGDAAHCIHPLAGLGVNLGLRDAMVLAQEIVDARRFDEDWGDSGVLDRYSKQRLPDVLGIMGSMEGLHRMFTSDLPGIRSVRGVGMRMIGNSGAIKKLLMRNSTGLSLPVPQRII